MDVEQLDKACRSFPVVRELLEYNLHLSVSMLAREMREKLTLFDRNHTRAQANLVDRMTQLEGRLQEASRYVSKLRDRVKTLESQESDHTLAQERLLGSIQQLWTRLEKLESAAPDRPKEEVSCKDAIEENLKSAGHPA